MYRAVIFDMDDTLIQTRKVKFGAHKYVAKKFYGLDLTDEDISAHWGKPFRETVRGIYRDCADIETLIHNYMSVTNRFPINEYEGAGKFVAAMQRSFLTGLVTATSRELAIQVLTESGIPFKSFDFFQTSEDTDFHKPDPRVFSPALEFFGRRGIRHDEMVYIGDTLDDLVSSRQAGIDFIGLAGHTVPVEKFREVGADYVTDFAGLHDKIVSR